MTIADNPVLMVVLRCSRCSKLRRLQRSFEIVPVFVLRNRDMGDQNMHYGMEERAIILTLNKNNNKDNKRTAHLYIQLGTICNDWQPNNRGIGGIANPFDAIDAIVDLDHPLPPDHLWSFF
jgi:hypothetical protein